MTKQKAFGLDIGTNAIKAVWLSRESKGYHLESAITVAAPPKGMHSESPLDEEEMAKAIRSVVIEGKIGTKYVNIALPENMVYTKVIEIPTLSDKELASAIYWEAEQYIPVPLPTVTLDYKVLYRPQAKEVGGMMRVLLVGAPTKLVDKYDKIVSAAGLSIASIETELISLCRVVSVDEHFPATLLVNVGTIGTSLAIIKNGTLVFAYSLPTGGIAISRAIAADFGFALPQAEQYKKTYGLADSALGGKIGKVAEPILGSILTEVKKAFAFYAGKYPDDPIKQIILSGGSAKLPGLTTYFTQNTGIETAIVNPWKLLIAQEVPKDIITNAPEYAVAAGLAMRE